MRGRLVSVVVVIAVALAGVFLLSRPSLGPGEFLVEDSSGDRMVIQVDLSRDDAIRALTEMCEAGRPRWVGGKLEVFANKFGFRFKPDTVVVAEFTAEGLQASKYRTIQADFDYWRGLGTVYILGRVVRTPTKKRCSSGA